MMDRRELLHRATLTLGGFISASAASGILAGCVATPEPAPPLGATAAEAPPLNTAKAGAFLTAEEMATVTAMADQILPKTDTPGAVDVGVPSFVDRMLAGYYTDKERGIVRAGLTQVATDAAEFRGKPFAALTANEQVSLMKTYDQNAYRAADPSAPPHFFRMIKELTLLGYCTSKAGVTATMRYEQIPGPYKGDVPVSTIGKAWAT